MIIRQVSLRAQTACRNRCTWLSEAFRDFHASTTCAAIENVHSNTAISHSLLEASPLRRELHNHLRQLQETNLFSEAPIQLALRGLEQADAPVRIAILGLNEKSKPGRLASLLLTDSQTGKDEEAEWATKLREGHQPGTGVVVRAGDKNEYQGVTGSPLAIVSSASKWLKRQSVEILVSNLTGKYGDDNPFTPTLTLGHGKPLVHYPVHKSIVLIEDFQGLLSGSIQALQVDETRDFDVVIDVDAQSLEALKSVDTSGGKLKQTFVSLDLAEQTQTAKDKNSSTNSNIDEIRELLQLDTTLSQDDNVLPNHLHSLIQSIVNTSLPVIRTPETPVQAIRPSQANSIATTVKLWSKAAHQELQSRMSLAYANTPYTYLSWWKLPWRFRDVNAVCHMVLINYFLKDAEKKSWWLGGRVIGEGYLPPVTSALGSGLSLSAQPNPMLLPSTYPNFIDTARKQVARDTIAPLHLRARNLALAFYSNITLTTTASSLMYLSDFSLYTSSSILAFGFVVSLQQLQMRWTRTQRKWEGDVIETGRKGIEEVEAWVDSCVQSGQATDVDEIKVYQDAVAQRAEVERIVDSIKGLLNEK